MDIVNSISIVLVAVACVFNTLTTRQLRLRLDRVEARFDRDSGGVINPGLAVIRNRSGHPERMYVNPWAPGSDEETSK